MLGATQSKVISLLGLFFGTVFFGVFPIKVEQVLLSWHASEDRESAVRRSRWGDTLLSWLLCFGGGVLFATCFIHMIPEVRDGFKDAEMDDETFPWTELIISCGFFLIYLVEEIVHWALCLHSGHAHHASETRTIRSCAANPYEPNRRQEPPSGVLPRAPAAPVVPKFSLERSVDFAKTDVTTSRSAKTRFARTGSWSDEGGTTSSLSSATAAATTTWTAPNNEDRILENDAATASFASRSVESAAMQGSRKSTHQHQHATSSVPAVAFSKNYGSFATSDVLRNHAHSSHPCSGCTGSSNMKNGTNPVHTGSGIPVIVSSGPNLIGESGDHHEHDHDHGQVRSWSLVHEHAISPIRSVFIILALSFHSLFEGLAIGLQKTATDVFYLFAAVSFHKFVITFCVGLELVVGGVSRLMVFLYILVFALVSPVGVAIGIGLSEVSGSGTKVETLTTTVLSGIAAGTLLYVTFFEVLQREREREGNGVVRVLFVIAGYAAMVAIELLNGHDHGHT